MLTGQPRFAGTLVAYAALDAWLDVHWDDSESIWAEYDDGSRRLVEYRARLVGRGGWRALSYADLKQMQGLLERPFDVTPRTRAAGDPPVAELLVPCRRTSVLQETTPLVRRDHGTGQLLYSLDVEFESTVGYGTVPGALYGGLVLLSEDEDSYEVETWGVAALTPVAMQVEFDGVSYVVEALDLTPSEIAELVLLEDPADKDAYILDAINDFQAPPVAE